MVAHGPAAGQAALPSTAHAPWSGAHRRMPTPRAPHVIPDLIRNPPPHPSLCYTWQTVSDGLFGLARQPEGSNGKQTHGPKTQRTFTQQQRRGLTTPCGPTIRCSRRAIPFGPAKTWPNCGSGSWTGRITRSLPFYNQLRQRQLENSPPEVYQLMGEVLYVHYPDP